MKWTLKLVVCAGAVSWLTLSVAPAAAEEKKSKALAGFELGVSQPVDALNKFVDKGIGFSPFFAYMFLPNIGIQGQVEITAHHNLDRPDILDDRTTWILGGLLGPRVAVHTGPVEIFGVAQAGIFTGLAPHSAVTDTSPGFSAGAGFDFPLTDCVSIGAFGRFNRLYQRVHGVGDVQYVRAGLMLMTNFNRPAPAPKVEVAQAAPPAEPPAPAVVEKKRIILRGVNFDFDKSNIRADAKPVLNEAASTLKENGGIAVIAEGHTDSVGSDAYNMKLSLRRAKAVRDYLVAGGIAESRVQDRGFGESKPVASNETDDGRAQNRRVELRVSGQ